MIGLYYAVLIGLFVWDIRQLWHSARRRELALYTCLMLAAAGAGLLLWLAPKTFGLVG